MLLNISWIEEPLTEITEISRIEHQSIMYKVLSTWYPKNGSEDDDGEDKQEAVDR